MTFFPQLIAGPIVHPSEMLPQFKGKEVFRFRAEDISVGLTMFTIGFFKKVVIADGIAPVANQSFDQALAGSPQGLVSAWVGVLAYTMQLYFDFSGYGDMALGLGRMFGLRLPINFNSPYKAANIADFWRRWHVTLSRFLRDHLYIPLGGNRKGEARRQVNLMLTMLLGGLWHGAGWLFVFWGGLHGLYLVVHRAFRRWRERAGHAAEPATKLGTAAGVLLTFLATVVAWVFFRAESLPAAQGLLAGMSGFHGLGDLSLHATSLAWIALLLALVWFTPNTVQLMADHEPALDTLGDGRPARTRWPRWRPTLSTGLAVAFLFVVAFLCLGRTSEFLYFQF